MTTVSQQENGKKFTSAELESALAYADHVMQSISTDYFLLDELAFFIKEHEPDVWLEGLDAISIGTRVLWFTDNAKRNLVTIVPDAVILPGEVQFEENGVPIRLTVVQKNYTYLQNLDIVNHLASEYWLPNPFNKYWAGRYLIK